jgi:hypothetical protein
MIPRLRSAGRREAMRRFRWAMAFVPRGWHATQGPLLVAREIVQIEAHAVDRRLLASGFLGHAGLVAADAGLVASEACALAGEFNDRCALSFGFLGSFRVNPLSSVCFERFQPPLDHVDLAIHLNHERLKGLRSCGSRGKA